MLLTNVLGKTVGRTVKQATMLCPEKEQYCERDASYMEADLQDAKKLIENCIPFVNQFCGSGWSPCKVRSHEAKVTLDSLRFGAEHIGGNCPKVSLVSDFN